MKETLLLIKHALTAYTHHDTILVQRGSHRHSRSQWPSNLINCEVRRQLLLLGP
ncbi:hypothetical protein RIEGSTA812A_PEG_935 [invertebrate metagenome]|uniref:Uncharacterized protein n=1 Tax=invertebrate metagenome TaxID=1711999 RepID=A0A484HCC5_9ZZZZ